MKFSTILGLFHSARIPGGSSTTSSIPICTTDRFRAINLSFGEMAVQNISLPYNADEEFISYKSEDMGNMAVVALSPSCKRQRFILTRETI